MSSLPLESCPYCSQSTVALLPDPFSAAYVIPCSILRSWFWPRASVIKYSSTSWHIWENEKRGNQRSRVRGKKPHYVRELERRDDILHSTVKTGPEEMVSWGSDNGWRPNPDTQQWGNAMAEGIPQYETSVQGREESLAGKDATGWEQGIRWGFWIARYVGTNVCEIMSKQ